MVNYIGKFIEVNSNNSDSVVNQRFDFCSGKKIPYIVLTSTGKRANVLWDSVSYSPSYSEIFAENEDFLKSRFFSVYRKYGDEISEFSFSCVVVNFSGLLLEDARCAAGEIFDIVNNLIKDDVN